MLFGQTDVCCATAAQCTRMYSVTLYIHTGCMLADILADIQSLVFPNFVCWLLQPEHEEEEEAF